MAGTGELDVGVEGVAVVPCEGLPAAAVPMRVRPAVQIVAALATPRLPSAKPATRAPATSAVIVLFFMSRTCLPGWIRPRGTVVCERVRYPHLTR